MPPVIFRHLKKLAKHDLKAPLADSFRDFWKLLALLALFAIAISCFLITNAMDGARERMLYAMRNRAVSLMWAMEGAARFLNHRHSGNIADLLSEMARQPGVAWIALVDADGDIIADSSPNLAGRSLFTPQEMKNLGGASGISGRFSPDDPDIYETWKLFQPARLGGRGGRLPPESYIFIAFNAQGFRENVATYGWRLVFMAAIISTAALLALTLAFYVRSYRFSRRELEDERALSRRVIESYPGALVLADLKGDIKLANRQALKMFKKDGQPQNLKNESLLDWRGVMRDLASGEPVLERECEIIDRDGRNLPVALSAVPIASPAGQTRGYLFVLRDMAEIRSLKRKLERSRRLSWLGEVASGLAHEIRNPLSSICGYACHLEEMLKDDAAASATASLLVEESRRLNMVLSDLLHLARPMELKRKKQPLEAILNKTAALARMDAEDRNVRIEIETGRGEEAPEPDVDADRLLQALLNLTLNAVQASPDGGEVRLKAIYLPPASGQSGAWRLDVLDEGPGLPEKGAERLFTPYFTTKANGTGLGLPLSRRIIEAHGGTLTGCDRPEGGAVFTVILPL